MPRCGAGFDEEVGAALRAALAESELGRSPLRTAAPTFSPFSKSVAIQSCAALPTG